MGSYLLIEGTRIVEIHCAFYLTIAFLMDNAGTIWMLLIIRQ